MTSPPKALRSLTCPRCGAGFSCSPSGNCWCAELPPAMPVPNAGSDDCLCPACLEAAVRAAAATRTRDAQP